jgi:hypothetical protein
LRRPDVSGSCGLSAFAQPKRPRPRPRRLCRPQQGRAALGRASNRRWRAARRRRRTHPAGARPARAVTRLVVARTPTARRTPARLQRQRKQERLRALPGSWVVGSEGRWLSDEIHQGKGGSDARE